MRRRRRRPRRARQPRRLRLPMTTGVTSARPPLLPPPPPPPTRVSRPPCSGPRLPARAVLPPPGTLHPRRRPRPLRRSRGGRLPRVVCRPLTVRRLLRRPRPRLVRRPSVTPPFRPRRRANRRSPVPCGIVRYRTVPCRAVRYGTPLRVPRRRSARVRLSGGRDSARPCSARRRPELRVPRRVPTYRAGRGVRRPGWGRCSGWGWCSGYAGVLRIRGGLHRAACGVTAGHAARSEGAAYGHPRRGGEVARDRCLGLRRGGRTALPRAEVRGSDVTGIAAARLDREGADVRARCARSASGTRARSDTTRSG